MTNWNQPICERCWTARNLEVSPGLDISYRIPVRVPSRLIPSDGYQCCHCGWPTWAGIFVRADPTSVTYPAPEKEDEEPWHDDS